MLAIMNMAAKRNFEVISGKCNVQDAQKLNTKLCQLIGN